MITETDIPKTLKNFGVEYCLQGVFDDLEEMKKNRENWEKIGHGSMVKKSNRLYVTRFRK